MVDTLIRWFVRSLLWLRYSITVRGFRELAPYDGRGILFLPNHPGLIEPIIMMATLSSRFRVGVVADSAQVNRPVIRALAKRLNVKTLKDPGRDRDAKAQIEQLLEEVSCGLNRGESYLLYPAGRIYRKKLEDLGGNSAVARLLAECPNVRVVLARTHGLWGSAFSRASGNPPEVGVALKRGLWGLLKSGILFAPRRRVEMEFAEPADLPRGDDRNVVNRYLELFYNQGATANTYVPYSIWETGGVRELEEPAVGISARQDVAIPETTKQLVYGHLRELTGLREIRSEMRLATELSLDSLARVELQVWLESEFGFPQSDGDALDTVQDVLLAACGEGTRGERFDVKAVDARWFKGRSSRRLHLAEGATIIEAFLNAASASPSRVICADQSSGIKSYRELLLGIFVLKAKIERFHGEYVGILLPASVAATVAFLATLFSGKIPVMLNWTTGPRGVQHAIDLLGIQRVVSAEQLIMRLSGEGFGEATSLLEKMFYLDKVSGELTLPEKLRALIRSRFGLGAVRRVTYPETAVVLFTSGSENVPKAVPLTHANILTNDRDVLKNLEISENDALLAMLPPFHSFGLTVDVVLPMLTGLRVVFHNNPTESAKVAALVEKYQATLIVGTPTFLGGIVGAAKPGQLSSLRLAVTGAEACSERVYDAMAARCPEMAVLEGYGITECSPVVSVNVQGRAVRGSIGELLPSLQAIIVEPDSLQPVPTGSRGMLLVAGPSVFSGYLRYEGDSPFVRSAGQQWYRTGDLVRIDERGILTFLGRMKRFIKLGGEIVSLPAIEAVLERAFPSVDAQGPVMAVECSPGEHPELTLFASFDLERPAVNQALRDAGLSPLHNIRRIVRLDSIPILGTGKTDYRALKGLLTS